MGNQVVVPVEKLDGVEGELQEKFSRIKINKKDLRVAELAMQRKEMKKWDEHVVKNMVTGLEEGNLDTFIDLLSRSLKLPAEEDDKMRAKMEMIKITRGCVSDVQQLHVDLGKGKSVYGFVVAMKEEAGTISIGYAFHNLDFEMAEGENNLTAGEINAIKNTYGQHGALKAMKTDGVIAAINYE